MKTNYFKSLTAVLFVLALSFAVACSSDSDSKEKEPKTGNPTQTTAETKAPSASPAASEEPQTEEIFNNYNIAGVSNPPTDPPMFKLTETRRIYSIQDYHWNNGQGKTPGTIHLKAATGRVYGPWQAEGSPGQGGVPDAYWTCYPDIELPAGTYTVVDSDPVTWAQNSGSNGIGMTRILAVK